MPVTKPRLLENNRLQVILKGWSEILVKGEESAIYYQSFRNTNQLIPSCGVVGTLVSLLHPPRLFESLGCEFNRSSAHVCIDMIHDSLTAA